MSKKYTFTMVVVKPTGKGGKPLKPKEIKPKNKKALGGSIEKVPGGYSKEGSGRISDKGLKGRSPQQVFAEKEKRMENTKAQGMTKKMGGGMMKKYNKGGQMLKNPKKADLDKDGKLSGYEKKRGMAIEKNMKPKKASMGALIGFGADKAMRKSQTARDTAGSLGLTGQAVSKFYNKKYAGKKEGGEIKKGYGAARTSGMGLQDENLTPGKTMDYYKDLM